MSWVSLNAQWAIASGALKFEHKLTSISNCSYDFDLVTTKSHATLTNEQ